jgi:hypothetical protein
MKRNLCHRAKRLLGTRGGSCVRPDNRTGMRDTDQAVYREILVEIGPMDSVPRWRNLAVRSLLRPDERYILNIVSLIHFSSSNGCSLMIPQAVAFCNTAWVSRPYTALPRSLAEAPVPSSLPGSNPKRRFAHALREALARHAAWC